MRHFRWWSTFIVLLSLNAHAQGRKQTAQNQPASQSDLPTTVPTTDELDHAHSSHELVTPPNKTKNIDQARKELEPIYRDLKKEKRQIAPSKKDSN